MKAIFLDIDGVLTNESTRFMQFHGECVEHLAWLLQKTGALLVISSSWRGHPELYANLRASGLMGVTVGETPKLICSRDSGVAVANTRGDEIAAWIESHERIVESIVILDDDDDMGRLKPYLVQTKTREGLTFEHARRAAAILIDRPWKSKGVDMTSVAQEQAR